MGGGERARAGIPERGLRRVRVLVSVPAGSNANNRQLFGKFQCSLEKELRGEEKERRRVPHQFHEGYDNSWAAREQRRVFACSETCPLGRTEYFHSLQFVFLGGNDIGPAEEVDCRGPEGLGASTMAGTPGGLMETK